MSSKTRTSGVQKKSKVGTPPPSTPNAALASAQATAAALPTTLRAVVQGNALKVDNK